MHKYLMRIFPLAIVFAIVLMVGCRRSADPSANSGSMDEAKITVQREDVRNVDPTSHSVESRHIAQNVSEIVTANDQELVRYEEEIETCDREINALENIYSEQDKLVRAFSEMLSFSRKLPEGFQKLLNDRYETSSRIKTLEEQRRRLIAAEEQRRRKILEK